MRSHMMALSAALAFLPLPGLAHDSVAIIAPCARTTGGAGGNAAVFMVIDKHANREDRLIAVSTDAATKARLHTHSMSADGMMQMLPATEGFAIPLLGQHALARGVDHVMLTGLTHALVDGDIITLTLTFAASGEMTVAVPVDNARIDNATGQTHDHGTDH